MIDQLTKLVSQFADDAIVKNDAIPNQHNQAVVQEVASSIFSGLQNNVAGGNLQDVIGMFNGQSSLSNSPMVSNIGSQITSNLASKFGISPAVAQSVASRILPQVLNSFVNKTNDPNDRDFDLQDTLRSLSGDGSMDLGSILGQFSGGQQKGGIGDVLGKLF